MFDLLQIFVKIILHVDESLRDNTRLVGSILICGAWLILMAILFPVRLGEWRAWFYWGGWIIVMFGLFLVARRRIWKWRGRPLKQTGRLFTK